LVRIICKGIDAIIDVNLGFCHDSQHGYLVHVTQETWAQK